MSEFDLAQQTPDTNYLINTIKVAGAAGAVALGGGVSTAAAQTPNQVSPAGANELVLPSFASDLGGFTLNGLRVNVSKPPKSSQGAEASQSLYDARGSAMHKKVQALYAKCLPPISVNQGITSHAKNKTGTLEVKNIAADKQGGKRQNFLWTHSLGEKICGIIAIRVDHKAFFPKFPKHEILHKKNGKKYMSSHSTDPQKVGSGHEVDEFGIFFMSK